MNIWHQETELVSVDLSLFSSLHLKFVKLFKNWKVSIKIKDETGIMRVLFDFFECPTLQEEEVKTRSSHHRPSCLVPGEQ